MQKRLLKSEKPWSWSKNKITITTNFPGLGIHSFPLSLFALRSFDLVALSLLLLFKKEQKEHQERIALVALYKKERREKIALNIFKKAMRAICSCRSFTLKRIALFTFLNTRAICAL